MMRSKGSKSNKKEKKERGYRLLLTGVLISLILGAAFIVLVYNITTDQTITIGQQHISNMTSEIDSMISKASYEVLELADSVSDYVHDGYVDESEIRPIVEHQSEIKSKLSDGECFRVYYSAPGCFIIPGEQLSDDFDVTSREWYSGALKEGVGKVYITSPYNDLFNEEVCFSVSTVLSDGVSVVALDYKMNEIQDYLSELSEDEGSAVLVNTEGMIVASNSSDEVTGQELSDAIPEYSIAWNRLKSIEEGEGYLKVGGSVFFYNVTQNDWIMIYKMNQMDLYGKDYVILGSMIFAVILILLILSLSVKISIKNRRKAEEAYSSREIFFSNLKNEINAPIEKIINLTDEDNVSSADCAENIADMLGEIRESSLALNRMFDNMLAYSAIQKVGSSKKKSRFDDEAALKDEADRSYKKFKAKSLRNFSIRVISFVLTVVLLLLIPISIIYAGILVKKQGDVTISNGTEVYASILEEWVSSKNSTSEMMANMIEGHPDILDDYDSCVSFLGKIQNKYSDISLIYIGNSTKSNPVIMSDGWQSGSDYVVEAYSWYSNAMDTKDGYYISSVHYDLDAKDYVITFSRVLTSNDGTFLGVLGIDYNISDLSDELEAKYTDDEYAFLVTNSDSIMNHPNDDYKIYYSDSVSIDDTVYSNVKIEDKPYYIIDYNGSPVAVSFREEPISGFQIYVVRSFTSLFGKNVMLSLFFICLIIVCDILVIVLWRRINRWQDDTNLKLHMAVEEANNANNAKSQFLAQMSHEIRTPINAVIGMNEMILRETNEPNILDHAHDINKAGKMLLTIVNTILDFSKIENGRDNITNISYESKEVIEQLISETEPLAADKGLDFITDIDDDIPKSLYGDRVRVIQVIINILTNAVKYTREGSVTLSIKCDRAEEDVILHVAVIDTGIGIREEDKDLLFETFQRIDEEKNHNIEGTGLGLYIVKHFLEKMDSELEVESVYGEGSTFSFDLRQGIIDATPISEVMDSEAEADEHKILYAPKARALVVDDNEMNRKVAVSLLKRSKIQVTLAVDGADAIEKAREGEFDILLLDQMMPGIDGTEAMKRIREEQLVAEDIPIIVMTAHAIEGVREQYLEAGFDDYVSKPIDVNILEDTIRRWLPEELVEEYVPEVREVAASDGSSGANANSNSSDAGVNAHGDDKPLINFENEMLKAIQTEFPECDMSAGFSSCGEMEEFYVEMITMFKDLPILDELRKTYEDSKDHENFCIAIHGFKNNARSVGFMDIGELAFEMENKSREEFSEDMDELYARFVEEFTGLRDKLNEVIK